MKNQVLVSVLAASIAVTGCSIQSKHEDGSHKENVKIETPLGGMNVRTDDVDAKETGMTVFPGATPKEKEDGDHDEKKANVNIDTPWFGLKVVALTYQSSEPQEKIWDYYKKEMSRYGKVLECKPGSPDLNAAAKDDEELTCNDSKKKGHVRAYERDSKSVQLKVGTANKQRIVAFKPSGNGTEFSLVYVSTREKKETM
ncbi:MAG TPA: hypothetical protein VM009_04700 [Terriglobales bacterium]|nr:hypothetical protein [Terriglobales bacterium]